MRNLGELVTKQAAKHGDKTFCIFENEAMSYASLEATANAVANGLLARGCKKGERVAILLPNILEWPISFFGIVKAGAVAVPVNSLLKADEMRFILGNCQARRLITTPHFVELIREIKADLEDLSEVFVVDLEAPRGMHSYEELLHTNESPPKVKIDEKNPASIIYTAGMTGRPRGALLSHKNYLTNARQIVEAMEIGTQDRFMNILPMFHVNAQLVTFLAPLYSGGSMVMMRGFSPREFLPALDRYKATAFSGVPTVYAILNELPDAEKYDLSSLRFCLCGAAPMKVDVFEKFEEKFKAKIIEGYGLSEATCACSVNPLKGKRKIGSIGLPLKGVEMKIFTEEGREAKPGEEGEIVVRGDIVMLGYLNDEELTANTIKKGWLHTGDIGYTDEDGYFFIRGRKKDMIIRGGENIYPREVEEVLLQHAEVGEVAVVGKTDAIWGEEVVAYIVPRGHNQPSRTQIREFCRQHLADYKCPTRIVFVEEMPKTALMKVRRWALKDE